VNCDGLHTIDKRLLTSHCPSTSSHGTSCRNILCCVQVRVASVTTLDAPEDRLSFAVLLCCVTATKASLRRERCGHPFETGTNLVFQSSREHRPTGLTDRTIQTAFLCDVRLRHFVRPSGGAHHILDRQILDPHDVCCSGDVGGCFLDHIFATCRFATVPLRDRGASRSDVS